MEAFGVYTNVVSWDIRSGRSFYYSDYLEDLNIENKWPKVWRVDVKTRDYVGDVQRDIFCQPRTTDYLDETWDDSMIGYFNKRAFVFADYRLCGGESLERCDNINGLFYKLFGSMILGFNKRVYDCNVIQVLYEVFDGELFSNINILNSMLDFMRYHGAVVNWHDRLGWEYDKDL